MKYSNRLFCIAGVTLILGSTALFAVEKTAVSVLKNAYLYSGKLQNYAFKATVMEDDVNNEAMVKRYQHTADVKVSRPGDLLVATKGDFRNRTNYLHNGQYTMVDHDYNYYGTIKVPSSIDAALDTIFKSYGINAPLASLLYSDMDKRMKIKSGKYFGTKMVDNIECDYIAFKKGKKIIHVWIATGKAPRVISYSIIDTSEKGNPRLDASIAWKSNANIVKSDFIFTPVQGVSKISVESAN